MGSRFLVVGSGGREHALARKLAEDGTVYVAPGNAGMEADPCIAGCVAIEATAIESLANWASDHGITLTVVGPEAPLAMGIVDTFEARGLRVLGPSAYCAQLEASKSFAKAVMVEAGVATADFRVFEKFEAAAEFVRQAEHPLVIKADGLAGGKGVVVSEHLAQSLDVLRAFMIERAFGAASERVVIEKHLVGVEMSFMALVDGQEVFPLATSRDHKRLRDGDTGPNTGGMGAIVPSPDTSEALEAQIVAEVIRPVVGLFAARGHAYRGFLYAGLMLTDAGPRVLEFNVRLGDPETQALMLGMCGSLGALIEAAMDGRGRGFGEFLPTCAVVLAAPGYPEHPRLGACVNLGADQTQTRVYHAGTVRAGGELTVGGGRVLTVVATGANREEAVARAYQRAQGITFEGLQMRSDIGAQRFDHSQE